MVEIGAKREKFGPAQLGKMLTELNRESGFPIAVVANKEGLVLASSSVNGLDPERQSAVVAKVAEMASMASAQLKLGVTDEISIFDEDGRRLVCRPINLGGQELMLAVLVPHRGQAYRRATNKLITQIRKNWDA